MSFFKGVLECNATNDGSHPWKAPEWQDGPIGLKGAFRMECGSCEVHTWGDSEAEVMDRAREFDRANRDGRLL